MRALAAGVVRVRFFFWRKGLRRRSALLQNPAQHPNALWFSRGLSHLTVALDVSSSQNSFWLASDEDSSCHQPTNSVNETNALRQKGRSLLQPLHLSGTPSHLLLKRLVLFS